MKTKLLMVALALWGCASYPQPTEHIANAMAAVKHAQGRGAGQIPQAALALKLAEEEVAAAKELIESGQNKRADYMALRAYNDAELARLLADEHVARMKADQAQAQARNLMGQSP